MPTQPKNSFLLGQRIARSTRSVAPALGVLAAGACGLDYGDPGPTFGAFEFTHGTSPTSREVIVVVVDDRPLPDAHALRADLPAAVGAYGANLLAEYASLVPDRATWHPVDVRLVLVPASSTSIDTVVHPAIDAELAWTSKQATTAGAEALTQASARHVALMNAAPAVPFRPLERARDVAALLMGARSAATTEETRFVASTTDGRPLRSIGVVVLAATDDESSQSAASYHLDPNYAVGVHVVTSETQRNLSPDPARFPRLHEWKNRGGGYEAHGCHEDGDPPYRLFAGLCIDYRAYCEHQPIAEISPGLGDCYVEITTVEPPDCDPSRGWADPLDERGVRRPRRDARGQRVCEVLPIGPAHMAACVADPTCVDCGSGWCVTELGWETRQRRCVNRLAREHLRWVGGALPDPGWVHVTCREPP